MVLNFSEVLQDSDGDAHSGSGLASSRSVHVWSGSLLQEMSSQLWYVGGADHSSSNCK